MSSSVSLFLTMAEMVARATGGGMRDTGGPPVDWHGFTRLCVRHGVTILILPTAIRWPGLPATELDLLRQAAARGARSALVQGAALLAIGRVLDDAGIRFLVLKGVPLSCLLYGEPARRLSGDIDLLVAPADFAVAAGVLQGQGFEAVPGRPVLSGDPLLDGAVRDLSLHRGGILLELHQRVTANPHRWPVTFEQLYTGRQMIPVANAEIPAMGPEHLALYLFIHGVSHGWERLSWLADLAALCRNEGTRVRLHRQTTSLGMERAAAETFALMRDLLDCPPPPGAAVPARASWLTRRLAMGYAGTGHGPAWLLHNLGKRWRGWRLRRGAAAIWRELAADLVNPIDHAYFHLPRALAWLYPLLRPVGFLWRNFLRRR